MARQRGKIKLDGKMGDVVFYKLRKHGYVAREVGYVPKQVRDESFSFDKPRKNNTEFGYASRMGKLIREGVRDHFEGAEETDTHSELTGLIKKAVAADTNNPHGQRRLTYENVAMLKGFNWTEKLSLSNVLRKSYSLRLDGEAGTARLDIDSFLPRRDVKTGAAATHIEVSLVLVAVDYEKNKKSSVTAQSGIIELAGDEAISINLSCSLDDCSHQLLVAGVGVQGYQEVAGKLNDMADRRVFEIGDVWVE